MIPRVAIPISNREICSALVATLQTWKDEAIKLEKSLASYLGTKRVYAVNSGRTALYLSLKSLNLKPGTGVIVPAYTCPIVFEVILRLRLKPVLVDVDPKTYNINPELIFNEITPETKVIIPVHLFGRPVEMFQIVEIADRFNLFVIEDVAQALGAKYTGKKLGTFGDLAILSFGPGKSITSGEGGALVVNNDELVNKCENLQDHLPKPSISWQLHVIRNLVAMKFFSDPTLYGIIRELVENELNKVDLKIVKNCIALMTNQCCESTNKTIELMKIPSLSAKVARMQLKRIDNFNSLRIMNAIVLSKLLEDITDYIQLPESSNCHLQNTFTRFPVRINEDLIKKVIINLKNKGIDIERPYHHLPYFLRIVSKQAYVHAEELCRSIITVPNHPLLTESDLEYIASAMHQAIKND
jgi:dTDP-4-amino-4,6-dideoxygalactose transaminase